MPATARRMLATVNSSATRERQPEVPNLIGVAILEISVPCCTVILPQPDAVGKRGVDRGADCRPSWLWSGLPGRLSGILRVSSADALVGYRASSFGWCAAVGGGRG